MNAPASVNGGSEAPAASPRLARVGTLRYTAYGLFTLFFWLLWGDFIWTVMERVLPDVMPFLLKDLGASNTTINLLNRVLAFFVTLVVSPIVSFHSDRHRGRWGRRRPYLLWSTPFLSAFLILAGLYKHLGDWLVGADGTFLGMGTNLTYIVVIAVLLVAFEIADQFVNNIYYYVFNDVVPESHLARFLSLFRIVGVAGGAIWSAWIFPMTMDKEHLVIAGVDNFTLVTTVGGILYMIGFMVMCFMVKEGKYPPPPEKVKIPPKLMFQAEGKWYAFLLAPLRVGFIRKPAESIATYAKECFSHRFYWYFFLSNTCLWLSYQMGSFVGLRNRHSLGISFKEIGWLGALSSVASMIIYYPAGALADKFSPIRMYLIFFGISLLNPLAQCIWIFKDFGHDWNLYGQLIISLSFLPIMAVRSTVEFPMYMRLLPKERYGQFCSANEMVRSFTVLPGALLAGWIMDVLEKGSSRLGIKAMGMWAYRFAPAWSFFWMVLAFMFFFMLYREWQRRGGAKGYVPPEA